jgi:hypothetical protein
MNRDVSGSQVFVCTSIATAAEKMGASFLLALYSTRRSQRYRFLGLDACWSFILLRSFFALTITVLGKRWHED